MLVFFGCQCCKNKNVDVDVDACLFCCYCLLECHGATATTSINDNERRRQQQLMHDGFPSSPLLLPRAPPSLLTLTLLHGPSPISSFFVAGLCSKWVDGWTHVSLCLSSLQMCPKKNNKKIRYPFFHPLVFWYGLCWVDTIFISPCFFVFLSSSSTSFSLFLSPSR